MADLLNSLVYSSYKANRQHGMTATELQELFVKMNVDVNVDDFEKQYQEEAADELLNLEHASDNAALFDDDSADSEDDLPDNCNT